MKLLLVIIVLMAIATPRHYTKILALAQARVKILLAFFLYFSYIS
ncbi:hypothetical protein HPHPA17_1016 [Helicobacter pylori Hp A-17]|nr:hypothetical protein HPHPA17_1016 [Helicobacter pylori Hp A-17]